MKLRLEVDAKTGEMTVHGCPTGLFIDGRSVDSDSGATLAVHDPSTGGLVAHVGFDSPVCPVVVKEAGIAWFTCSV